MPQLHQLQDATEQHVSGTGTNTASWVQWVLAECYCQKYFFLMCGSALDVRGHDDCMFTQVQHEGVTQLGEVGHCCTWHVQVPSV